MINQYPKRIAEISEYWKTAPVSFEAYWWMTEWKRQGWAVDEIIEALVTEDQTRKLRGE